MERRERRHGSIRLGVAACVFLGLIGAATPQLHAQEKEAPTKAAIVTIEGEINDVLARSIERRLDEARADGVNLVIFEMDTPGGLVTSALDIAKMIKKLPEQGVRTAAWVNDQAYSAGALISVATQEILMSTGASIGDCAPIMVSPTGGLESLGDAERAKAESPILQEFRDSAIRNNYDMMLCQSMVSVGVEVWWLENKLTEERQFVSGAKKKTLIDDVEEEQREWRLVKSYHDSRFDKDVPLEQPIDSEDSLLTVSEGEAIAYGLASAVASNPDEVAAHFGISGVPRRYEISGWENFALWLNSPLVRGIVFVIMLMGAYLEFQSPGLIVPGATALVALGIFLGAPYAAGLADVWTMVLLFIGMALLAVEIFLIPGFGVAGISGILLILVAFIGTFVPAEPGAPAFSWPTLDGTWEAIQTGIVVMTSSVIIAVTGIALLVRYLPSMPFGRGLVLGSPEGLTRADFAVPDAYPDVALLGDVGVVTGDLRPGGQARFGQKIVDVSSQGEYVDSGRRVQVIQRDGRQIVVRPLPEETA